MGYPKIARLLEREGWSAGARIVRRLRRELGLAVPAKKPKRGRRGRSTGIPTKATHRNHVWTWGFVHDTTMHGGTLRMLNVLDEYTRECLYIHADQRINARKVRQIMSALIERHVAPEHIRSHNGSESIESGLRRWLAEKRITTLYTEPASPWFRLCGRYVESFKGRFRKECLNREQLWTLTEAPVAIEDCRWKYNNIRPHRSLGYIAPLEFAQELPEETAPNQCWDARRR